MRNASGEYEMNTNMLRTSFSDPLSKLILTKMMRSFPVLDVYQLSCNTVTSEDTGSRRKVRGVARPQELYISSKTSLIHTGLGAKKHQPVSGTGFPVTIGSWFQISSGMNAK